MRQKRTQGLHAKSLAEHECGCGLVPEQAAPHAVDRAVADDPIYANLYDRFYGMMHDMGIAVHLAFAAAIGQDKRHIDGAREWWRSLARV